MVKPNRVNIYVKSEDIRRDLFNKVKYNKNKKDAKH